MLDDYTFEKDSDKPIRRKKKWNYGFYFPEFEFEDEENKLINIEAQYLIFYASIRYMIS